MPLPDYEGFAALGAVHSERRWKRWECRWAAGWAGASRVPWPPEMLAAPLVCGNTITAQGTEGRDYSLCSMALMRLWGRGGHGDSRSTVAGGVWSIQKSGSC